VVEGRVQQRGAAMGGCGSRDEERSMAACLPVGNMVWAFGSGLSGLGR
jgi:hypothetical protein